MSYPVSCFSTPDKSKVILVANHVVASENVVVGIAVKVDALSIVDDCIVNYGVVSCIVKVNPEKSIVRYHVVSYNAF